MFDIVVDRDGYYQVSVGGVPVDSFEHLEDAEDCIRYLKWERDMAFADVGIEFDEPWLK